MLIRPQHIVLFHHFRRFLEAANKRDIDVAPIKGAHLLTSVYGDNEDRGMLADVDFLVRPGDWERTLETLEIVGFVRKAQTNRPATHNEFHEAGFFLELGGGKRILFEPHRQLVQIKRHEIDYDALWDRSEESTFDDIPCRRLKAEDHLLHAAIHLMSHSFIDPKRGFRDIELLINVGDADLDVAKKRSRQWECERALWLALEILRQETPELKVSSSGLKVPSFVQHALKTLVPNSKGFLFPRLGLRQREAILFPLLMDGPRPLLRFAFYYANLRLRDATSKK